MLLPINIATNWPFIATDCSPGSFMDFAPLLVFGDPEGFFGILFTFRRHFKAVELIQSRFKSAVIVDAALAGKY